MQKTLPFVIFTLMLSGYALAESRAPYDQMLKTFSFKERIEIDGEAYVRAYLKPKNPDIDLHEVRIWVERNGETLKIMKPVTRSITEDSANKDYPLEVLLPTGKKYSNGTELVHNLEKGGLQMYIGDSFSAEVKNNRIRYNDLIRSVQKLNNMLFELEKPRTVETNSPPMVALLIQYPEIDLPATIVIEMKSGDVSIPVTSEKFCILEDRKSIRDENPWVKLPPYSLKLTAYKTSKPENWEDQ